MSRNILKKRPPASPNKPPPAPAKMVHQGQPVPLNVNFFVQGSTIQRSENAHHNSEKRENRTGIAQVTKFRPHSAHVDKHVLQSMSRSPSVDSSFYDRFERLDRDTVIGDMAYKEKGGRVKSAVNVRNAPKRPSSSTKPRKRSKSASSTNRKHSIDNTYSAKRLAPNNASFFEMAMSFDDETNQNTLTNAVRQISPRTLGIETKSGHVSRRPRSGRKTRERSVSSKRSEGSESHSSQSIGNSSWCSSRGSRHERQNRKQRTRKSRSRTRRTTQRPSDHGKRSTKSSPERITGPARSASATSQRKHTATSDNVRHRFLIKNLNTIPTPSCFETTEYKGDFAYNYTPNRPERKTIAPKKDGHSASAINAVKKANDANETLREMREIDRIMFREERRPISSKLPKLKMIVAPTAMPLASLVRSTSAKMLMANPFEHKRTVVDI